MNADIISSSEFLKKNGRFDAGVRFFWLGGAPRLRQRVERETGVVFNTDVQFQGLFHRVFQENRDELLELYSRLGAANRTSGFWRTSIASKSSSSEPIVRVLVLLLCAERLISRSTSKAVIVVDSPGLGLCLSSVFNPERIWFWRRYWAWSILNLFTKATAKHLIFLLRSTRLFIAAVREGRRPVNLSDCVPRVLMRTWVTNGVVRSSEKPAFHDRNFGGLRDVLIGRGFEVWLLPMFFNIGGSERQELNKLRAADCNVIDEFSEISIWDIIVTTTYSFREMFLWLEGLELRGSGHSFDVSRLFLESHWRTHGAPDLLRLNLAEKTLSRLARKQVKWKAIYYPFENNASEKSFLIAAKACYPTVPTIGFQHTVVFRDQLSMRLSPGEVEFHPLPDRLLCSGPIYLPVLKSLGFPASLCELGANLRYASIENSRRWSLSNCQGLAILYVLNFNLDHAYEVLAALAPAFRKLKAEWPDLELRLKSHPLIERSDLMALLRNLGLGEDVVFVAGSVQDEVLTSRVTVMTGASVSNLETVVTGAPLIRFSLEQEFDFDCFWPEFAEQPESLTRTVSSEGELYSALRVHLCMDASLSPSAEKIASLRHAYFVDPATANLESFLPTPVESDT